MFNAGVFPRPVV